MAKQIPDEMKREGRPIDPVFESEEDLYIRFSSVVGKKPSISSIRCPDQSVNRSKYSEAEWVILPPFSDWGYGAFKVEDIPPKIIRQQGYPYDFRVKHDPFQENYSHSEIRAYVNGTRRKKIDNKNVKLYFRMRISQKTELLGFPSKLK